MLKLGNIGWKDYEVGWKDVRIDRATPLGNPFDMKGDETVRALVCESHRHWLWQNLKMVLAGDNTPVDAGGYWHPLAPKWKSQSSTVIVGSLNDLMHRQKSENLRLMCWCVQPDRAVRCHGHTVIKAIAWMEKEEKTWKGRQTWRSLVSEAESPEPLVRP